ncbi:MAG: rubrerythrin family protein [Proteobacteria bacterium]|nr:rubrerythrin family protein [Pseudomonadota bacterium]
MADQTEKNLEQAFAGESQANRRYLAFAQKALDEGFPEIAKLLRAIAQSETIHAHNHLRAMGAIKSTLENLEEALHGEKSEYTSMYPMFMDQAKRDINNEALKTFYWAKEAEKVHGELYEKAIRAVKLGKDLESQRVYVCGVCGYTVEEAPPDKCPVCGEGRENFEEIK